MCVSLWKKTGVWLLSVLMALQCCCMRVCAEEKEQGDQLSLYAQAAVLMDADSGRVLYGKNENEVLPMASTTKIMTCILALEYGNVDQSVEVSAYASRMPKVRLGAREGEHFRLGDLLYSLMLESHNDSAVVIAEAVGGSAEAFAGMMNQKARDLGCEDTYFITPNGLDAENGEGRIHATTAADLAKIMAYCVTKSPAKESFLEITQTQTYRFDNAEGTRSFVCNNHNAFLTMMDEALSGKTGFTNNAGYCYVGAVESEGRTFTVALLACGWPNHKTYKWSDMKHLVQYGMEHYAYYDIYEAQSLPEMTVNGSLSEGRDAVYAEGTVSLRVENCGESSIRCLLGENDRVEVRTTLRKTLQAPVEEGEKIGSVSYYLNGDLIREYAVLAENAVRERTFGSVLTFLVNQYLCVLRKC